MTEILLLLHCCTATTQVLEKPVDSTESLVRRGKVPINSNTGGFWQEFLVQSVNPWEQQAGSLGITFGSGAEQQRLIREEVGENNIKHFRYLFLVAFPPYVREGFIYYPRTFGGIFHERRTPPSPLLLVETSMIF